MAVGRLLGSAATVGLVKVDDLGVVLVNLIVRGDAQGQVMQTRVGFVVGSAVPGGDTDHCG